MCRAPWPGRWRRSKARAIGIEDTSEKCVWAVRHGGFSACINRCSESLNDRLWQLAPQGCDIFFDTTDEWLGVLLRGQHLAPGARVVSCARPGSGPQGRAPGQGGIRIACLDPTGYQMRRGALLKDAIAWYGAGRLTCREDIAEGIERAPEQLGRALRGECFGNPLMKL